MKPKATGRAGASRTPRQLRVAEEIRHVLAAIFARVEFRDPALTGVAITVTEVRISPDLKHATAFVARLGRNDVAELLPALKRAAPFIRSEMAKPLAKLRVVPDVTFQADTALEYAQHVDKLLRQPEVERDLGKAQG